jgi:two-component sensor histidine kinase
MTVSGRVPPDSLRLESGPQPAAPGPYQSAWRFTAPALDSSVPRLRHAVRDLLAGRAVEAAESTAEDLLLIVSELVTNAVRHAAVLSPRITVEIAANPRWVKVAVADDHPYRPKALQNDPAGTSGRGLLLVEAITSQAGGSCGVQHVPGGGKAVWAVLPLLP